MSVSIDSETDLALAAFGVAKHLSEVFGIPKAIWSSDGLAFVRDWDDPGPENGELSKVVFPDGKSVAGIDVHISAECDRCGWQTGTSLIGHTHLCRAEDGGGSGVWCPAISKNIGTGAVEIP